MQTVPVSMRLNQQTAAYVVQGVMTEANNINGSLFATQIQNTVSLLYSMGGLIGVQAGSLLEQRLIAAARQAQAAQNAPPAPPPVTVMQPPPQVVQVAPPPVAVPAPVPAPVSVPAPQPQGNPEITIAGQPVIDVQVTPLG